jgi:ubiquinone/menaquinone biosynthesis C-methylase UbiE
MERIYRNQRRLFQELGSRPFFETASVVRRVVAHELMDDPAVERAELAANFDDIEFVNRAFGGIASVASAMRRLHVRRLLDVGCGSGDIARALLARARAQNRPLEIVALDASETVLAIARERSVAEPALSFVLGDAARLPFADASFDVATCNLALHHFEPAAAVTVLSELRRVARVMPIVSDLERSGIGYAAAALFARFVARNRLTKNDAPLSVKRAYTAREVEALARSAGWRRPTVRRTAFFRLLLVDRA